MDSITVLQALGTVALALLSGAGGAALLDLYYKSRRDSKKAATLLLAEILINTELLLLQTHARVKNPKGIPGDFKMSALAWDTAAPVLAELPAPVLKSALVLYNRYHYLNNCVSLYSDALADIERHPPGPNPSTGIDARRKAERHADLVLDVFNTGIDAAIDHGKELTPRLFALAKINPTAPPPEQANFQGKVDRLFAERQERLRRLQGDH